MLIAICLCLTGTMQNCPCQLAMQSYELCLYVRCGTSNQIKLKKIKKIIAALFFSLNKILNFILVSITFLNHSNFWHTCKVYLTILLLIYCNVVFYWCLFYLNITWLPYNHRHKFLRLSRKLQYTTSVKKVNKSPSLFYGVTSWMQLRVNKAINIIDLLYDT